MKRNASYEDIMEAIAELEKETGAFLDGCFAFCKNTTRQALYKGGPENRNIPLQTRIQSAESQEEEGKGISRAEEAEEIHKIYRSPGIHTGLGYIVGGGYSGLTQELDDIIQKEAALLQDHFGCNVVIRFNSDRRSGGAWVVDTEKESFGTNDSIGLGARLHNNRLDSMSVDQIMALSEKEWRDLRENPNAIRYETAINVSLFRVNTLFNQVSHETVFGLMKGDPNFYRWPVHIEILNQYLPYSHCCF